MPQFTSTGVWVDRWYNNVCIVGEFDQCVAYVHWLEVRRSDDERRWAYRRALDDAGQDVRQFGSVALKSGVVRMATEEVLDPIVYGNRQG